MRLVGKNQKAMTTTPKFLCSRQTHFLTFVKKSQFVRQIVDICIFPWYPVPQQSRFTQRKPLHNFVCPLRSFTKLFCRHPPTTKSFGAVEPFSFRETCGRATGLQFFIRTLTTALAVRTGYSAMTPPKMRASLTTPLQNRGRNLIRGERRTTTDTSIHLHTPTPGFENLHPLLNLNF